MSFHIKRKERLAPEVNQPTQAMRKSGVAALDNHWIMKEAYNTSTHLGNLAIQNKYGLRF